MLVKGATDDNDFPPPKKNYFKKEFADGLLYTYLAPVHLAPSSWSSASEWFAVVVWICLQYTWASILHQISR